jgi:hypothetical protein
MIYSLLDLEIPGTFSSMTSTACFNLSGQNPTPSSSLHALQLVYLTARHLALLRKPCNDVRTY